MTGQIKDYFDAFWSSWILVPQNVTEKLTKKIGRAY